MVPAVALKTALPKDAECLSQLVLRAKGDWWYDQTFLQQCQGELTYTSEQLKSKHYFFAKAVALSSQQIIGFYALAYSHSKFVKLEALFVRPIVISHGIGSLLLKEC
jgi:N-acetylglutamate synthase-like GNAT family acetyltransferase